MSVRTELLKSKITVVESVPVEVSLVGVPQSVETTGRRSRAWDKPWDPADLTLIVEDNGFRLEFTMWTHSGAESEAIDALLIHAAKAGKGVKITLEIEP